jgi:hypothetical protein
LTQVITVLRQILYAEPIKREEDPAMELNCNIGDRAIQDVIGAHPEIGDILNRFDIGCVTCKVGICLLKDVVTIHGLKPEDEAKIAAEISSYLTSKGEKS